MTYKFSSSTLLPMVILTKLQDQQKAKRNTMIATATAIDTI